LFEKGQGKQIMIKAKQNNRKKFAVHLPAMSLNITIMATLLLFFVFLGATSYLYMQSSSAVDYKKDFSNAHRQALEKSFRQANAQQEWKQLYQYHGNPTVVIYENGKTPYFYNKQGKKCAFIPPPKKTVSAHQPVKNSEYSVTLTLDQETIIE